MGHHAGGFPVPGEHHRGRGRAARGEFRGEPHAATVGGHAAREAGGCGGGGEALADLLAGERHDARGRRRARGPGRGAVGAAGGVILETGAVERSGKRGWRVVPAAAKAIRKRRESIPNGRS